MPEASFPGLPAPDSIIRTGSRRIAIASVDIAGPLHCGGVGAAYHGLALALAKAGHDVTVVYLYHAFFQGDLGAWVEYFEARGIRFIHLPQPPGGPIWYGNRKEASLRCYQWLREQPAFAVLETTRYGGSRILDMLVGDPLPRIC